MPKNFLTFGIYATRPPVSLLRALQKFHIPKKPLTRRDVRKILLALRQTMKTGPGTITKSFEQSRFTTATVIWRKRQRSCGSYATIVASVARYFGLPCKLIDGDLGLPKAGHHHAWNEIYIPAERKYVAFDTTHLTLRVGKQHRRKSAWADWHDIEKVYNPKKV